MPKYHRNKKYSGHTFSMLRHDIHDSQAYLSLSPAERAVYMEVLRRYNSYNNGEIPLSCREAAERCNIGKNTASRALKALQERGFIKVGKASGFNMKHERQSTRWIITHEAIPNKSGPTNEWKKWRPDQEKNTVSS